MKAPHDAATDASLVEQVQAGCHAAFALLYDRHVRMVRAVVASASGDNTSIDDMTQEVFLRAYLRLEELRDPGRFKTWLFGVARNVAKERRRSLSRDRHQHAAAELLETIAANEHSEPADREEVEAVLREIDRLPDEESLAMRLFFLEECDAAKTAESLGVSRSGVYAILKRACRRIAEKLVHSSERKST